jgi:hypothetical protein
MEISSHAIEMKRVAGIRHKHVGIGPRFNPRLKLDLAEQR